MAFRVSARVGGRVYSTCSIEDPVDSKIRVVCVEKRLLRSSQVAFERSAWDLSSRDGGRVYLGDLELSFPSEDEACAFVSKILSTTYERALEGARRAAEDYLRRRSRVLGVLLRLRRNPRSVLISEASSLEECRGEPLECLVERLREESLSAYRELSTALEGAMAQLPPPEAERARSAVYLVAMLQSKFYEGDLGSIHKILDLVEAEHGYSADRASVEKIVSRQELEGVEELCRGMLEGIFKRISSTIYLKFRCTRA